MKDVVNELVRNSLDAESCNIAVRVDLARGYCMVSDDGYGIREIEFSETGHLARMHCA